MYVNVYRYYRYMKIDIKDICMTFLRSASSPPMATFRPHFSRLTEPGRRWHFVVRAGICCSRRHFIVRAGILLFALASQLLLLVLSLFVTVVVTPERYAFFRLDTIFGFFSRYDTITIRYFGLKKDLLLKEFSANFHNFQNLR